MTTSAIKGGRKGLWARLRRDEGGAYAVEIALLLPFFIPLIIAIIEIGMLFLASHMLDLGASKASRLIRVGTAPTESVFRSEICSSVSFLMDCSKLQIDVKAYTDFDAFLSRNDNLAADADGNYNTSYAAGGREEIQLVRVMYNYPLLISAFLPSNYATKDGRLLTTSFVFRNEPW